MYKLLQRLVFILSLVALPLSAGVEYEIIPLAPEGYVPGGNPWEGVESRVLDLSESGFVAGAVENYPRWPVTKGFLYHPETGFRAVLGPLENGDLVATKVNNQGLVAGWINKEEWTIGDEWASCGYDTGVFIYDSASGQFFDLRLLEETKDHRFASEVLGITDDGKVLLSGWKFEDQEERGFIFDTKTGKANFDLPINPVAMNARGDVIGHDWFFSETCGMMNLGSLDPYGRAPVFAKVLNEKGAVAGEGYDLQLDEKGFIWDLESGLKMIQTLGGDEIRVKAINNCSQVVGSSTTDDLVSHAFIYDESLGTVDLGTLGGKKSSAYAINDLTQVVGSADSSSKAKGKRAFIWDPANGMRDLNDLIPSGSGWKKLKAAKKINNQGFIVGEGIYQGEEKGFLLIPKK